ncbi:MAG: ATP-binding cassette domain-containing protein [Candidatus Izimaplasma sp.]|nr:ATP-binding cassette domain-containing protein [Candidatus Izimaplasma bacterium]
MLVKAIDDVSFDIYKGEVFGLVGESGCGKTTTGRTIIKLHNPTDGEIYFKGQRIGAGFRHLQEEIKNIRQDENLSNAEKREQINIRQKEIRERIQDNNNVDFDLMKDMQMIFQDPIASLNPRMTVKEIVAEGLRIAGERKDSVINEKVNDVLETVGLLPEHASRYPHEFSGGQRQRIGIARALIISPDFIIADEPISALDVSIQAQVMNLLNDLRDELGITILFIAHDLSVVKYFSNRIGVMYYGNLVELADSEEIFLNPLHPYTRSLLSAVPLPDPLYEKNRKRIRYNPAETHDYSKQKPTLQEIKPGHFILANDAEIKEYKKGLK